MPGQRKGRSTSLSTLLPTAFWRICWSEKRSKGPSSGSTGTGSSTRMKNAMPRASAIQSTTPMFHGHGNVHVRVKPPSRSDLMHLKVWSDGEVLREGSASWSPAALKRQDNNVRFSRNATEVKAFEADFEAMWNRPSNTVVQ